MENSQGLIDMIKDYLKGNKQLKTVVEKLLDTLLAKDTREGIGCDNMSAILVLLKWSPLLLNQTQTYLNPIHKSSNSYAKKYEVRCES